MFLLLSDFYLSDLPFGGGAEYNDQILYDLMSSKGIKINRKRSRETTQDYLVSLRKDTKIIVSNFIQLSEASKNYIINNFDYIIYEHDHKNNIPYELISDKTYYNFLKKMAKNQKLIFLPTIPETFSRICIEAKMMGCSVITNGMVGAKYEEWYHLKGQELIDTMVNKRDLIIDKIEGIF